MIRLILVLIIIPFIIFYTMIDAIVCFFISFFNKDIVRLHSERFVKLVFKYLVLISGSKVHIKGKENIDALANEKSFFVVSNHRGFYDIITGYLLFDKNIAIVSKNSLERIPILAFWMKRIKCIFLNRKDLRDGVKMVLACIKNINEGISMWIFPEGTRCKSEDPTDILEFKAGVFKIPEKTNCYILPIAFKNTEKIFEDQEPLIEPADIYINIGKAYKIDDLTEENKINISKYTETVVKKLLMEDK